ncbi:MAG: asparagine synthase (glutamine-hydrolyzing) [Phycisphaerales bacterium]
MCGIAGAIGAVDAGVVGAVRAASECQRLRGPDSEGEWPRGFEGVAAGPGGAFLAFRRLKIIDLSPLSDQPMVDPATGNVLVFNGEVYNFRELRRELEGLGHAFRSSGDGEVVLKAYAQWGNGAIERLRGMFGLAIWDPRRRRALLARDRLGIKPLFYAKVKRPGGGAVVFASQVRSLLAGGLVERRLDPVGLSSFVWNGFVVGPASIIRGVQQLPAGCTAEVDAALPNAEVRRYWQLPRTGVRTFDAAEVGARLEETVRQHLVSDVPLGVFLSGGRDSSAITAVASRVSPTRIRTFNIGFDEARYDEGAYARSVASALGTEHHEVRLSEAMFREHLEGALRSIDQPTFDSINSYFVSRAVREAGLTVAMAGTGGDELFGGYRSFRDLPLLAAWSRRLSLVPGWAAGPAARALSRLRARSLAAVPPQTRWGKLADALATRGDLAELYQVGYGLFTADFAGRLSLNGHACGAEMGLPPARAREVHEMVAGRSALSAISALELDLYLGERLLRDTDAASMGVSLEVRVPLLDHEFVEAVCAVDDRSRFQPLMKKSLLHKAAMPELPEAMFDRPKAGFELPLEVWCGRTLRGTVGSMLSDAAACEGAGLSPGSVASFWRAYDTGVRGLYWTRVWALFILLWWCREHRVEA